MRQGTCDMRNEKRARRLSLVPSSQPLSFPASQLAAAIAPAPLLIRLGFPGGVSLHTGGAEIEGLEADLGGGRVGA